MENDRIAVCVYWHLHSALLSKACENSESEEVIFGKILPYLTFLLELLMWTAAFVSLKFHVQFFFVKIDNL